MFVVDSVQNVHCCGSCAELNSENAKIQFWTGTTISSLFFANSMYNIPTTSSEIVADFASDTMTKPCVSMLARMAASPVGDNVFDECPTTSFLESHVASITGKEAALFVTSCTMANQLALISQIQNPASILLSRKTHINM